MKIFFSVDNMEYDVIETKENHEENRVTKKNSFGI